LWDFTPPSTLAGFGNLNDLLAASFAEGTKKAYKRTWSQLQSFLVQEKMSLNLPLTSDVVCKFLNHLHTQGYAGPSIASAMSAISCIHKLSNFSDPTDSYLVRRLVQGCKRLSLSSDSRLPVTADILRQLVVGVITFAQNEYERKLVEALLTLAFHGLLRIGEYTDSKHNLTSTQVQCGTSTLVITFSSFKHSIKPVTITVAEAADPGICAVRKVAAYRAVRGQAKGPFFAHHDMSPVKRKEFCDYWSKALNFADLSSANFKPHSLRIGGASYMAQNGASDAQIRQAGRWSSSAFLSYIRI
jgi:hypothetical protein